MCKNEKWLQCAANFQNRDFFHQVVPHKQTAFKQVFWRLHPLIVCTRFIALCVIFNNAKLLLACVLCCHCRLLHCCVHWPNMYKNRSVQVSKSSNKPLWFCFAPFVIPFYLRVDFALFVAWPSQFKGHICKNTHTIAIKILF